MAARTVTVSHNEETRAKIQTSQLINRLQDHALSDDGPELSAGRLKAIEILLRKSLPDLTSVTIGGDANNPVEHVIRWKSSSTKSTTSPDPTSSPSTTDNSASPVSSATAEPGKP